MRTQTLDKNVFNRLILLSILFMFAFQTTKAVPYDYKVLTDRIAADKRSVSESVSVLDNWVATQTSSGAWSDLNYGKLTTATGSTVTNNHAYRLWQLAAACSKTGNTRYNDASYKTALLKGLQYWYNSNTTDPNWWYNWIYFPQKLGEILIFMRDIDGFIPRSSSTGIDEAKIISLFKPTAISDLSSHGPGANEIDMALHYMYRGILTENPTLLENTRDKVQSNISDYIQEDMVYHEHGPQIHIASYGWVLANGITQLAYYVAGTNAEFDVNNAQFARVIQFIRETQISSMRGKQWDFSIMGRGISRVNAMSGNLNFLKKIKELIDPTNAQLYTDALDRISGVKAVDYNVREFNKQYWNSDYMQHSRKKYLFAVRNVSTRTVEAETGNGENLKAYYLSNGATYMSVDGTEYQNIMPYWDWSLIPGTTLPYITTIPNRNNWGYIYGATSFVGGVSDGNYGACTVDQYKNQTYAKKSWFFFDDEIVCLGAGITESTGKNIRTTIDQHIMQAQSYILENGQTAEKAQSVSSTNYQSANLKYIRNGKFAYFFPENQNVNYTMRSQTGSWYDINSTLSTATVSGYVFTLWIDHGTYPANASYSYIVVPGIETAQQAQSYNPSRIQILSNTKTIQAVSNIDLNIQQIVFHAPGTLHVNNMDITVNRPCVLLIRNDSVFTVSDPSQSATVINVTLSQGGYQTVENVSMPIAAGYKGSSVSFNAKLPMVTSDNYTTDFKNQPRIQIANDKILISTSNEQNLLLNIYSVFGQKLKACKLAGDGEVNVEDLPAGNYILQVTGSMQQITRKFTINQ